MGGGRLAFERLQQRMHHRGTAAARAALEFTAHLVAFDLLRVHGQDPTGRPFTERHAALEALFLEEHLSAPWSLCPTTTDPEQAAAWLADYTAVDIEGLVFGPLASSYVPGGRGWTKYKMRQTAEATVGAVTRGRPARPRRPAARRGRRPPVDRAHLQRGVGLAGAVVGALGRARRRRRSRRGRRPGQRRPLARKGDREPGVRDGLQPSRGRAHFSAVWRTACRGVAAVVEEVGHVLAATRLVAARADARRAGQRSGAAQVMDRV
ncbi:hypothetical protein [Streptomyces sp. NPDC001652]|uniref:ATP-dependent DNA ligase n=1 Tax=Streptomyces sp. NPDC001652 TaxID=3154393 RepID=UPI0033211956